MKKQQRPGRANTMTRTSAKPSRPARSGKAAQTEVRALEKRLRMLEDMLEISRLKAQYCDYVDGGWDRLTHNGQGVASLFVKDGVWDAGANTRSEGQDAIRKTIDSFQPVTLAFHRISNPVIEVNGDEATGNWHIIAYLSQPDGTPMHYLGLYTDRFVRTAEGWKFKELLAHTASYTTHQEGWVAGPFYQNQPAADSDRRGPASDS